MKIAIIAAMSKELALLLPLLENHSIVSINDYTFHLGHIADREIVACQSGIGKVNAAVGVSELIRRYNPYLVVSTGCAGGGCTDIEVMDVVVSTELAYHDVYCGEAIGKTVYGQVQGMPARYKSPSDIVEIAKSVSPRVHSGLIVTGDWFVDSREKMREIVGHFPEAAAVDMESAAIAQTCHIYGIPFISFRVISDIPLKDTNAAMYHDFWNTVGETSFQTTRDFLLRI